MYDQEHNSHLYRVFNPLGRTSHLNKSHKARVWAVIQTVFTKTYLGEQEAWSESYNCATFQEHNLSKRRTAGGQKASGRGGILKPFELEKSNSTLTWKSLEQKQVLSSRNASPLTQPHAYQEQQKTNSRGIQLFSYSNPHSKKKKKNGRGEEFGIGGTKVPLKHDLYLARFLK